MSAKNASQVKFLYRSDGRPENGGDVIEAVPPIVQIQITPGCRIAEFLDSLPWLVVQCTGRCIVHAAVWTDQIES